MQEDFLAKIHKMHKEFDKILERNNFDLLQEEVQTYSRCLDEYIVAYMQKKEAIEPPDPLKKV